MEKQKTSSQLLRSKKHQESPTWRVRQSQARTVVGSQSPENWRWKQPLRRGPQGRRLSVQGAGDQRGLTALGRARGLGDARPGPDSGRAASAGAGVGAAALPGRTGWDAGLPAPAASPAGRLAPPGCGGPAPLHLLSDGSHGSEETRFLLQ